MAAEHGIVGEDFGTALPQTEISQQDLANEKNMAKFSRSKEYKALKEHLEQRIEFYQTRLPDGRSVTLVDTEERVQQWVIANAIIGEFRAVIQAYENARQAVQDASQ